MQQNQQPDDAGAAAALLSLGDVVVKSVHRGVLLMQHVVLRGMAEERQGGSCERAGGQLSRVGAQLEWTGAHAGTTHMI